MGLLGEGGGGEGCTRHRVGVGGEFCGVGVESGGGLW